MCNVLRSLRDAFITSHVLENLSVVRSILLVPASSVLTHSSFSLE